MRFLKDQLFPATLQRTSGIALKKLERKHGIIAKKGVKEDNTAGDDDLSDSDNERRDA